ncbi:efflux transporter outer membrane subunit [Propionivibrio dicarboxylicus]|uniref:Efflux transporter, outer membrane factor (OMF) lipoprotein, NodT family n=1 Tax=Propionivibrio dicarboxylicus TaxID=83767 RepID=A0A1G8C803_9RHOO|nr:efflux transporter outer membrane subunit [Propionivibrio dicarboxylicus]SDH41000.1 efflux transporter, outer membrane factor (OMF) lipoprotein, NodT family [Propionivibrio dicarboxylicus]
MRPTAYRPPALAVLLAALLALGGCANYAGIVPEVRQLDELVANATRGFDAWPEEGWWHRLNDPQLAALIDTALADNPGLQAASARVRRAEALAGNAESALWPSLGASTSNTRERFSEHGMIPPPYAGTTRSINELQLLGQWEIDFFGKNRATLRAALGEAAAAAADRQAARHLLAANIARGYLNLARLIAQRDLAGERQRQRSEFAELVQRRFAAGIDTGIALEAATGAIPENARDIAAFEEQIGSARHLLAALAGKTPEAIDSLAPTLPENIAIDLPETLPAGLLAHRADVTAARRRVEAALNTTDATKAMFYPNVNLRGFTGFSAIGLDQWLDTANRQSGIGLALSLPVFDAGRLRSLYRVSTANLDEAVAAYNGTLLEALRDVADQLTTLAALDHQIAHQQATLQSAERNFRLADQRYRADIADRLSVLNAEAGLINQRRAAIDLQARRLDTRIRLIHALGGGFSDAPAAALARQ